MGTTAEALLQMATPTASSCPCPTALDLNRTYYWRVDEVNGADTAVRVKSISLDPNVPEGAFRQTPAPGMSIETADCP